MRVTSAPARKARINKIKKSTKGMTKSRRSSHRLGKQAIIRSLEYAYRDRRNKKRDFRRLWITRINAAARLNGTTYGQLMSGLKKAGVNLDRKVLAELAVNEPEAFAAIVKSAK